MVGSHFLLTDINECETTRACHSNATCSNTEGSYNCSCVYGYIGDGFNCTSIPYLCSMIFHSHYLTFQELTCVMLDPLTVTLMQPALTEMEAMTVNAMMATLGMEHIVKV